MSSDEKTKKMGKEKTPTRESGTLKSIGISELERNTASCVSKQELQVTEDAGREALFTRREILNMGWSVPVIMAIDGMMPPTTNATRVCETSHSDNHSDWIFHSDHTDYSSTKCYTLVELTYFRAIAAEHSVTLEWETDMEVDNAGFYIWRSETEDGEYVKINDSLIPAEGSGYQYSFTDDAVVTDNTYYYKLEDIDLDGVSTFHGPVSTKRSNSSILPIIQFLLRD